MHLRAEASQGSSLVIFDTDQGRANEALNAVVERGFRVLGCVFRVEEISAVIAKEDPDQMMVQMTQMDETVLDALAGLPDTLRRPVVLVTGDDSLSALEKAAEAGVNAVLRPGSDADCMRSAIHFAAAHFHRSEALRAELDQTRARLRDRKVIERAKGLVMQQKGLCEAEAYELLRNRAMQKGMRLADVANMVNEAAELISG